MQQVQQIQVSGHMCIHHACSHSLSFSLTGGPAQCPSTVCSVPPCPVSQSVQLQCQILLLHQRVEVGQLTTCW